MNTRLDTLTITLHWLADGHEQANIVVCEDSPPARLVPLLLAGCGLPVPDSSRSYQLRLANPQGPALRHDEPVSANGVRSGSHLWLVVASPQEHRRWLLCLPDGSEVTLPSHQLELSRGWLLALVGLLNREAHVRELERLERRESPYAYVSKGAHCLLTPEPGGRWLVSTARADVATLLNGARLFPEAAEPIGDGDRLTLGAYGPTLALRQS